MRHITVEFNHIGKEWGGTLLRITEQTHRGEEFTEVGECFKASNGLRLISGLYPQALINLLYVRGKDEYLDNTVLHSFSPEWEKRVLEAVEEYNKVYADPPAYCSHSTGGSQFYCGLSDCLKSASSGVFTVRCSKEKMEKCPYHLSQTAKNLPRWIIRTPKEDFPYTITKGRYTMRQAFEAFGATAIVSPFLPPEEAM